VMAGCMFSIARALAACAAPPWEQTLLVWALAVLYASQIRVEALRQRGQA